MRDKKQAAHADRSGNWDQRFDDLSPAALHIWAKSGESEGHGLLPHMLDVAAIAERILSREPFSTLAWAEK